MNDADFQYQRKLQSVSKVEETNKKQIDVDLGALWNTMEIEMINASKMEG